MRKKDDASKTDANEVSPGVVVGYQFVAKNDEGETIAESGDDIEYYLHGHGHMMVGIEKHTAGRRVGDVLDLVLPPEDAFGVRDEGRLLAAERGNFPEDAELEPGTRIYADTDDGEVVALWVVEVNDDEVLLDANHPLAGLTIHMHMEIVSLRQATAAEKEHGHPHDADSECEEPEEGD
jgi:FKBP-type peptidyl-prolyl cis-trans isomerase SlyD